MIVSLHTAGRNPGGLTCATAAGETPSARMSRIAWRLKLSSTLVYGASRTCPAATSRTNISPRDSIVSPIRTSRCCGGSTFHRPRHGSVAQAQRPAISARRRSRGFSSATQLAHRCFSKDLMCDRQPSTREQSCTSGADPTRRASPAARHLMAPLSLSAHRSRSFPRAKGALIRGLLSLWGRRGDPSGRPVAVVYHRVAAHCLLQRSTLPSCLACAASTNQHSTAKLVPGQHVRHCRCFPLRHAPAVRRQPKQTPASQGRAWSR